MPPVAGLHYLLEYHTLELLLASLNIIIVNFNSIIINVFNSFAKIWTPIRPGKFLQSHGFTIELAATDNLDRFYALRINYKMKCLNKKSINGSLSGDNHTKKCNFLCS